MPSTLHQCIKYIDRTGDTIRIFADKKPFTIAESFYVDAKFYFEPVDKVQKPKSWKIPEPNVVEKEVVESSSKKKTYQYIPSNQRKKGDPIFRVIDKSHDMKGTNFPTPLPPLVQYRIKQSQKCRIVQTLVKVKIKIQHKYRCLTKMMNLYPFLCMITGSCT